MFYQWESVLSDDEDEIGEADQKAYEAHSKALKIADELTKNMGKDDYIFYAECRSASFTYKKLKLFKDWCDLKEKVPSDVLDVLGFLAHELVGLLTSLALTIKRESDGRLSSDVSHESYLFAKPSNAQTPIELKHMREAYRRMQKPCTKAFQRAIKKTFII